MKERLASWLVAAGLQDVKPSERSPQAGAYGRLVTETGVHTLEVVLPEDFPHVPPAVLLAELSTSERRPHLVAGQELCWVEREGLLVNHHDPQGQVEAAILRSRRLLEMSLEDFEAEFLAELEVYWRGLPDARVIKANVLPRGPVRRLKRIEDRKGRLLSVTESAGPQPMNLWPADHRRESGALVLPMAQGAVPPFPGVDPKRDLSALRQYVKRACSWETRQVLARLGARPRPVETVIFIIPRLGRGPALVGVSFLGCRGRRHPLAGGRCRALRPLVLQRVDRSYLILRGGSDTAMSRQHVAVVGCGAIGGYVAVELARAGVGQLTLVDPDVLEPNNLFRHVLGAEALGWGKAEALSILLMRQLPYLVATPIPLTIGAALRSEQLSLTNLDAIVVAVDNPSAALMINQVAMEQHAPRCVVSTWLEAYGLATHAVRTTPGRQDFCLECLFTDWDTGDLGECRLHLAAPGQTFNVDVAGCGARYAPFRGLDATRAATMAVEQVLEGLEHPGARSCAVTWRGDAAPFLTAGHRLSDRRWPDGYTVQRLQGAQLRLPECRICR